MIQIHDNIILNFRMSGSRRASVISMGANEIAELFEKLFDNLNQFKFTEAREFISKSAKKLPRNVLNSYQRSFPKFNKSFNLLSNSGRSVDINFLV